MPDLLSTVHAQLYIQCAEDFRACDSGFWRARTLQVEPAGTNMSAAEAMANGWPNQQSASLNCPRATPAALDAPAYMRPTLPADWNK